jgi:hypothetical protein
VFAVVVEVVDVVAFDALVLVPPHPLNRSAAPNETRRQQRA